MTTDILPATAADGPALRKVLLSAFSDDFNRTLFPATDDVRQWWDSKLIKDIENAKPHEVYLKVVDNRTGGIVAMAKWDMPPSTTRSEEEDTLPTTDEQQHEDEEEGTVWPPSCDRELCDRFFGTMAKQRTKFMGERAHCYLDILVVDPAHQRRGLGSRLVEWGLARADELGVEAFLTASPFGKPLYEKQGFQVVASELILGDYVNTYMVRPAKAAGKG